MYYTFFYGNGDSKAFKSVENAYGPEKPVKSMNVLVSTRKGLGHVFERKEETWKDLVEKVVWLILK